jgi:methyl-accepting chemotaxis protein
MRLLNFSSDKKRALQTSADAFAAISQSQAIITFNPDGTVIDANDLFLGLMGYTLAEIQGRHHRLFVEQKYAESAEYEDFWRQLRDGHFQAATFKRLGKNGNAVWIEATYSPLRDADGAVYRVVKVATDVTAKQLAAADAGGQMAAISRSQAIIEFALDGTILWANDNFCAALGYSVGEIVGKHHSLFVRPVDAQSPDYAAFWRNLAQGQFQAAQYLRIGKGGREVWIQASYNPIFDTDGKPYKVVKFATDITQTKAAVNTLGNALALLAQGNLLCSVNASFPSELDPIRLAFNQTVMRFTDMVSELRATSSQLRGATGEILSGANDLSERTTHQAAAIEQTTASVAQLSQTVTANAARADAARKNAQSVSSGAVEAGAVMSEANIAMQDIAMQASKISNIISLIDDIAFQTNLLALNASVEAARAGDAGKGFAVVAVEVRRLAQSAAGASSDVKILIERSGQAVATGTRLVSAAAEKLDAVVGRVGESTGFMDEIAAAGREQASAIAEVSTAMRHMDEMTQHNAALVEEMNAAIEQTETQASRVDGLVDVFVVEDTPFRAAAPTQRRAASPAPPAPTAAATRASYGVNGNTALAPDWSEF